MFTLGNIAISNAIPVEHATKITSIYLIVENVSIAITPILTYFFIGLTSYMMIQVFTETDHIGTLFSKLWISFVPVMISSIISYIALIDIQEYNIIEIDEIEILDIKLGFGITLKNLKLISNISYAFLYIILTLIIMREFKLSFIKSITAAISPSIVVVLIKFLI